MKDKNKGIVRYDSRPIFISLSVLIPILILVLIFLFWYLDKAILNLDVTFLQSFVSHIREVLVLTVCIFGLAFYYVASTFHFRKPKKTDTLASSHWVSLDEQLREEDFKIAPIDTSKTLERGGAPINKISDKELLYDLFPQHDLTLGITRSGKSRKIVRQLVMLLSMANESMIFNDPKKEMYQDFHLYLEKKGYDVYVLDFRKPDVSMAWNPLDDINYFMQIGEDESADQYAEDQVSSLVVDNGTGEPIWIEGQKALIKALILEVSQANIPKDKKNYYSVVQTMSVLGKEMKVDGETKMLLSVYMESLDEDSSSRVSYTPIANSPDKTRGSFMTSALATLHPFTGKKLMKILSHSDFNFHDFKDGKKALFVVNPDEKKTYDAITAMVFDNAYQSLVYEATQRSGNELKKRAHMIFDEFGNMPKIANLESKLTVALSRGILFHLYLQDFKQMNEKYGDNVASIIRGNCGLWYFISSADFDVCEEMSKKLGNETIWVESVSGNYSDTGNTSGGNVSMAQQTRRLMDANELLHSDIRDGHGIILTRTYLDGPCKVNLPDCSDYAWYKEMEHDETEVKNKDLTLSYAIPRYIVINRESLKPYGLVFPSLRKDEEVRGTTSGMMQKRQTMKSEEMYWYWSTRDDLEGSVMNHVASWLKKSPTMPERKVIQNYMKSDEFIKWLWSIDIVKDKKEESNMVDSITNVVDEESDNALADLLG